MNAIIAPSVSSLPRASEQDIALSRAIGAAWKAYILEHHATAAQHAAYALLRGKSLEKTFPPLRRPSKIHAQGGITDRSRRQAEASARGLSIRALAPFAGLLDGQPTSAGRYLPGEHALLRRVMA